MKHLVKWGHHCIRPHRYDMYNHVMHRSSQLTRQTPSSCYFKHTIGKRSKHCQYSLENQEAIWAVNRGMLTICGNIVNILHEVQSHLRHGCGKRLCWQTGHRHFLFLPDFSSQYNDKNWNIVFIALFLLLLSFLSELFTEWEQKGVEVSWILQANTTDGFWLWMVDRCSIWPVAKEFQLWACWKTLCP